GEAVGGARLAAGLRERHGDEFAVGGRDEPVDRGGPLLVESAGVEEHAGVTGLVGGGQDDEERLLFRRLLAQGEDLPAADGEREVARGLCGPYLLGFFARGL